MPVVALLRLAWRGFTDDTLVDVVLARLDRMPLDEHAERLLLVACEGDDGLSPASAELSSWIEATARLGTTSSQKG
jgi:hypothetical protein